MLKADIARFVRAVVQSDLVAARREIAKHREPFDSSTLKFLLKDTVERNDVAMVQLLVENGANVEFGNEYTPEGAIYYASKYGAVDVVRWLLGRGVSVNYQRRDIIRCLSLLDAATGGHLEIVRMLVEHGAALDTTVLGKNALNLAMESDRAEVCEYLRSIGMQPIDAVARSRSEFEQHLSATLGSPEELALGQIVAGPPMITVRVVDLPSERQKLLVTEGMSSLAMTVPPGEERFQYAELVMRLRDDWPLSESDLQLAKNRWPVTYLLELAHFPHDNQTWLGGPVTCVTNGEPPKRLGPGTKLSCAMLMVTGHPYSHWKRSDGVEVVLFDVTPLYNEEREFGNRMGIDALLKKMDRAGISRWLNPRRVNSCIAD